ncbi:amidohydrolase family protein [Halobellus marinus]|uniref:amidohydrolase family protein n=1 Tax=Halobellus TaxID=1073986 RepID=UPI0028AF76B4|nr:amidohydrolase [Halobellus sp. DFY28]
MVDTLVTNGTVVTQNDAREVLQDGTVAIQDGEIVAVGPTAEVTDRYDADEVVDASDHLVLPGLINAHTHVSDILFRGCWGDDRTLFDWLYNVKRPGVAAMDADDHRVAAELYCLEAIKSGMTTFVENDAEMTWEEWDEIETKLDTYDRSGIRSVYARGFMDQPVDDGYRSMVAEFTTKEPGVEHPDPEDYVVETEAGLDEVASLIEQYHGTAEGRREIWIAPVVVEGMTTEGLQKSYALAERHDVMTTTHVSESQLQEQGRALSSVEYLSNIDYLGEHALLAHCIHISERDARILAATDTRVSHNLIANLFLGSGLAPLDALRNHGVTTCVSTDNASCSDTVNLLKDAQYATLTHRGANADSGVVSTQAALDMVTRDAARAMRKGDALGSLETGKRADVILLDADRPHMTPVRDAVSAVIHQAQGHEVDTVICDGDIVMRDGVVTTLDESSILQRARETATAVIERSGLDSLADHDR